MIAASLMLSGGPPWLGRGLGSGFPQGRHALMGSDLFLRNMFNYADPFNRDVWFDWL